MRPVKKQTFREQIVDELKAAIITGQLELGSHVVEADLAVRFGVSRGPLREALRHLIEEGFLTTIPYTGTRVVDLSLEDVREVFTLRTELEIFAFKLVWPQRDKKFEEELRFRNSQLKAFILAEDDEATIAAELGLHSFVYEACGHRLLLATWQSLKGKLQLYWATHYRIHGRRGPRLDAHELYVDLALGDDFEALSAEVRAHMLQGFGRTEAFLLDREARRSKHSA